MTADSVERALAGAQAWLAGQDAPESVIHYYRQFASQEGNGVPWDGPLFSWVLAPGAPA